MNTHTHRLYWAHSGCLMSYFHTLTDCIQHTVDAWCLTSIHSQTVLSTQWMPDILLPYTHRQCWAHSRFLTSYFHTHTDCIEHTVDVRCITSIHSQTVFSTQWMPDALLAQIHRLYWAHSRCLTSYFHTLKDCIEHTVDAWHLTSIHSQTVLSTQWMWDVLLTYTQRLHTEHTVDAWHLSSIHLNTVLSTEYWSSSEGGHDLGQIRY